MHSWDEYTKLHLFHCLRLRDFERGEKKYREYLKSVERSNEDRQARYERDNIEYCEVTRTYQVESKRAVKQMMQTEYSKKRGKKRSSRVNKPWERG